jgi:hypothetical protein
MRSDKGTITNKTIKTLPVPLDTEVGVFIMTNKSNEPVTLNVSIVSAKFSTNITGVDYRLFAGERFVANGLVLMSREFFEISVKGGTVDYYYTITNETKRQ